MKAGGLEKQLDQMHENYKSGHMLREDNQKPGRVIAASFFLTMRRVQISNIV